MNWTKILGAMRSLMQRAEPSDRAVREQITDIAESLRASQEGMSDGDLRAALWQLLESAVAAFEWVEAVYPDDHEVIYTTWPPDEGPKMWVRSYSVDESGEVTLTSEPVEVEAVLRYEPVSTAAEAATGENDDDGSERVTSTVENDDEPKASEQPPPCSCNEPKGATEKMNENVKALIGRLIASAASPFESSDEEMLANFCEGTLVKLAESYEAIDATADEEEYEEEYDEEVEEDEDTVSVSATELAELKQLAAEQRARTKREKDALVSKLVGATGEGSRSTFESMELAALRQLASDLKVNEPRPDFALAEGGDPAIAPDAPDPAPSLKSAAREDHERRWNRGGVN